MRLPHQLRKAVSNSIAAQAGRRLLWVPTALMTGILLYFSLSIEPWAYSGAVYSLIAAYIAYITRHHRYHALCIYLLISGVGFTAAQYRTHSLSDTLLAKEYFYKQLTGTVDALEPKDDKTRITLSNITVEGIEQNLLPRRVRISARDTSPAYKVGDRVTLKAALSPLPDPTHPGGYDFAQYFYFLNIGANGFSMSPVTMVETASISNMSQRLSHWRNHIATTLCSGLTDTEAEIATAMTVGQRGGIDKHTQQILRDAGLVHILAISGLHVSLVTGILFFAIRLLLSLYPPVSLRIPAKKIAAIIALLGAFSYLALADFPLSAQRAFIMMAFVLIAIIFDRQGISLRSIALAATCILLLFPEVLLGASFQLSFAATLAIIALYEHAGYYLKGENLHPLLKILRTLCAIMLTSLAASLATAPFVIYHFNRIALLGIIANVLALPLTSLVIMPSLVATILLMPLGMEFIAFYPLQYSLQTLMAIASWAAALPGASMEFYALTPIGLVLAALGIMLLCLIRGSGRLAGIALWCIGLGTIAYHQPTTLYISKNVDQIMAQDVEGEYVMLRGTARAFAVEDWLQTEATQTAITKKALAQNAYVEKNIIFCELDMCHLTYQQKKITVVTNPKNDEALNSACQQDADILIAPRYVKKARCPKPKIRIGRRELNRYGPHALYVNNNAIRITTARTIPRARLWLPPAPQEWGELY